MGVGFVIDPDAHTTKEIAFYKYGVNIARTLAGVKKLLAKKSR